MDKEKYELTDRIIRTIFEQARNGFISIGDEERGEWPYFIKFYQKIADKVDYPLDDETPIVVIPDYDNFVKITSDYLDRAKVFYNDDKDYFDLSQKSFEEKLFMDLFVSATNYDLNNIEQYIQKRTQMLSTKVKCGSFTLGHFQGYKASARIKKNPSNLEGPYKFGTVFSDEIGNKFVMPAVTYGIIGDKVYIYAVQGPKKSNSPTPTPLERKLDRYFRKVNKGVPEELQNISPNALVSFTLFCSYLQAIGKTQIIAPDFMPLRYEANKQANMERLSSQEDKDKYIEKHNHDQYNITDKFMHLLQRYSYHFDESESVYEDNTQMMYMHLPDPNHQGESFTEVATQERIDPQEFTDQAQETSTRNIIYDVAQIIPDELNRIHQQKQESEELYKANMDKLLQAIFGKTPTQTPPSEDSGPEMV